MGRQRDGQTDNSALTLSLHWQQSKGDGKCLIRVFCKAVPTAGNTDRVMLLLTRWAVWRWSEHQHCLPDPKSFVLSWLLLPSCRLQHGGIALLTLLLLDTDFYSDCISFSCKFFKTTADDKMLHYMLKVWVSDVREGQSPQNGTVWLPFTKLTRTSVLQPSPLDFGWNWLINSQVFWREKADRWRNRQENKATA